jgi:hypothetical protein
MCGWASDCVSVCMCVRVCVCVYLSHVLTHRHSEGNWWARTGRRRATGTLAARGCMWRRETVGGRPLVHRWVSGKHCMRAPAAPTAASFPTHAAWCVWLHPTRYASCVCMWPGVDYPLSLCLFVCVCVSTTGAILETSLRVRVCVRAAAAGAGRRGAARAARRRGGAPAPGLFGVSTSPRLGPSPDQAAARGRGAGARTGVCVRLHACVRHCVSVCASVPWCLCVAAVAFVCRLIRRAVCRRGSWSGRHRRSSGRPSGLRAHGKRRWRQNNGARRYHDHARTDDSREGLSTFPPPPHPP